MAFQLRGSRSRDDGARWILKQTCSFIAGELEKPISPDLPGNTTGGGESQNMVIWLIGMSGAGKTTIGRQVCSIWKARATNTVFVDGDEMRQIFKHDQHPNAYSLEGRSANADRIAQLCAWLDRQQINVVCCILSIFEETRRWNRLTYSKYYEVYVSVPLEILTKRDTKDLYQPALRGELKNVVGVDIPFMPPASPDLVIDNSREGLDVNACARQILTAAGVEI